MPEECEKCAECSEFLYELHKRLASILPLISNQESFAAKMVRGCIDDIKALREGGENEH